MRAVAETFRGFFWGEGRKSRKSQGACSVKIILSNFDQHCLDRRQSSWKSIANKTCIRSERKLRVWGIALRNIFKVMPSRMSENALLSYHHHISIFKVGIYNSNLILI